jgi:DUF917 family protein
MPTNKITTMQEAEDLVSGCLFLGTGGGGSPEKGLSVIKQALDEGLTLSWVDMDEIDDDVMTVTPFGMGSIAPQTQAVKDEIEKVGMKEVFPNSNMEEAVKALGDYLGQPIGCLVAAEPGGSNLPVPLVTGARLGIPVVDGDYAGRAIPDEMQGTPFLYGKNSWPTASVDEWGNVAVVTKTQNPHMFERIGKMLAVAAYGSTAMAATPLVASEMKEILVPGTITKCMNIGKAIRQARENNTDPVDAALAVTNGWRVFEGTVVKKEWEDRDGYMFGVIDIDGSGRYEGQTLKVWFKNENHISWLNGEPWICSPDLLTLAYPNGEGTTNTKIAEGDQVVAAAMKGLEGFRTEFGLNCGSGPRYFGFDIDYVPIEDLVGNDS